MTMTRREFIKAASAAGCLTPFSGISRFAYGASSPDRPLLVVVFLRGGADGLNIVGPAADPEYVAARPPELRVLDTGDRSGIPLDGSLDSKAGFRLHSNAVALGDLYQSGRLAIIHAVGLNDGTRSHFVAQDLVERGLSDEARIAKTDSGWLARAFADTRTLVTGYSATASPAFATHGLPQLLSAPDLSAGLSIPWGAQTSGLLRMLSAEGNSVSHRAYRAALDMLDSVDRRAPKDGTGKWMPYAPSGKANYEGAGDLSRSLASVARLAKMDVELNVACVDHGGWDTHEGQAGRIANQVRQLSTGLAAFHEDMAVAGRKSIMVVMTEFGRRLRANKSGGTDHGHGACWMVLGDRVRGGRMYGRWPGLATPQLDQGVDLAVTTDYRRVLAEVLGELRIPARGVFPGWTSESPLGIIA